MPGEVWVLDASGSPRAVPVRAGIGDGTVTEILSGELREGDQVIIGLARAAAASRPASAGPLPRFGF